MENSGAVHIPDRHVPECPATGGAQCRRVKSPVPAMLHGRHVADERVLLWAFNTECRSAPRRHVAAVCPEQSA